MSAVRGCLESEFSRFVFLDLIKMHYAHSRFVPNMDTGDTNGLAITVEWNLPQLNHISGPAPIPLTRYAIPEPNSVRSHIEAVEGARSSVNDILTHLIEKGNWPQSLPLCIQPKCSHGFPYTEVECMYSPSHWTASGLHPNERIAQFVKKMLSHSPDSLLKKTSGQLDIAYGDSAGTKIDMYGVDALPPTAPVFAFIHGGYWQEGSRKQATVMVENLFNHGAITALIGYDLAPDVSLEKMVQQMAAALAYLDQWCLERGSRSLYLCGHSAGAHLLATAILSESLNLRCVKALFLLGGVYDVVPLIGTCIDRPLGLTIATAKRLSPRHRFQQLPHSVGQFLSTVDIKVVVAEHESPSLREQSLQLMDLLKAQNLTSKVEFQVIKDKDHFSIVECLDDPDSNMFHCLRQWMGLRVT